ncbi:MAG TPA: ATP-grasp domain-containing protein [Streptosporangiaceae bacterium]|nr:ATP-grasp domain-containing protein [Streptosporangiaceae bacterium]
MKDENSPPEAGRSAGQPGADASPSPLLPPVLGMVGGGYRTRLTAQAAISLGIGFRVLADAADDSAAQVAPAVGSVVGDSRSTGELLAFAAGCEILTFEREDVPEELLAKLEPHAPQVAIRPSPATLRLVRDQAARGDWLTSLGLAVAGPTRPAEPAEPVASAGSAAAGPTVAAGGRELAVSVARSPEGQGVTYPVTLMLRRDGERREFIAPAPDLDPDVALEAQRIALKLAAELSLTGLLTIELIESGGKLTIGDLAAAPHDSGLWTMDGAVTSAFEQNLRALLDLPFGTPGAVAPYAATVTVLGGDDPDVFTRFVHVMAADSGARVHIYTNQVSQIRPGRRVGHVTVTGADLENVRDRAWRAANYLGLGTEAPDEDPGSAG